MHDLELRHRALDLIAAGVNDCEVGRRLGRGADDGPPLALGQGARRSAARALLALLAAHAAGRADRRGLRGAARPLPRRRPHLAHAAQRAPAPLAGREVPDDHRRGRGAAAARVSRHAGSAASSRTAARRWCCGSTTATCRACSRSTVPARSTSGPSSSSAWQHDLVRAAPWAFVRGCIRSDGCSFINRTGRYAYLSFEFRNWSTDILGIFAATCAALGLHPRQYARSCPALPAG